MANPEEKLAALVSLALGTTSEEEARTVALQALRFAEKHGLVILAKKHVEHGRGWDAAMRDEKRKRSREVERKPERRVNLRDDVPGDASGKPRPFDPADPQWHTRRYRSRYAG